MGTSKTLSRFACGLVALGISCCAFAADDGIPPKVTPISKLPVSRELPDPFKFANGKRVGSREDWPSRRSEILKQALEFEYGRIPTERTEVKASESQAASGSASAGSAVHQFVLNMGPQGKVSTHLILTTPPGNGPFPTIIKGDLCWGRVKPEIIASIVGRGYALVEFDRTEIAPDKNDRGTGILALYPDYDWGVLAAWAWGYERVIDFLETRPEIDKAKLVATGHSRGGKATLLAGAIDERIALTAPNGSGCGGAGLFRVEWPTSENLSNIVKAFPYWFSPQFDEFAGHENQLPFDQHEVRALIAPRALFTTDSLDDLWANPLGTQISYLASMEVFNFLGAGEKIGFHYRHGPHDQNAEDFAALLDFADWKLMGKTSAQKFDALPFPNYPSAYKWTAPK
jgi:hypothetical protein